MMWMALLSLMSSPDLARAYEEPKYKVIKKDKDNDIEIRAYQDFWVAEKTVKTTHEKAGNSAFRTLFKYISGENASKKEMAMTIPVGVYPVAETTKEHVVYFVLPLDVDLPPEPKSSDIKIRKVPATKMAALRYSGSTKATKFHEKRDKLISWLKAHDLNTDGAAIQAFYNHPWTLWFLRRNEVLIPLQPKTKLGEKMG